jgi:hypothetical protein
MLTLERARSQFLSLPLLVHAGLVILALGGLADVVAHVAVLGATTELHEHTAPEFAAHLTAFVGMVVILLGVVVDGAQRSLCRSAEATTTGGK